MRIMKNTIAIEAATTALLTVWQKSPNCWQIGSQLVFWLPLCARYTIAAEEAAAAVRSVTTTVSSMRRISRGATASGRTIVTMEIGSERTR